MGPTLQRHPFSGLVDSADSLVRVSRRVGWVADIAADPVRSLRPALSSGGVASENPPGPTVPGAGWGRDRDREDRDAPPAEETEGPLGRHRGGETHGPTAGRTTLPDPRPPTGAGGGENPERVWHRHDPRRRRRGETARGDENVGTRPPETPLDRPQRDTRLRRGPPGGGYGPPPATGRSGRRAPAGPESESAGRGHHRGGGRGPPSAGEPRGTGTTRAAARRADEKRRRGGPRGDPREAGNAGDPPAATRGEAGGEEAARERAGRPERGRARGAPGREEPSAGQAPPKRGGGPRHPAWGAAASASGPPRESHHPRPPSTRAVPRQPKTDDGDHRRHRTGKDSSFARHRPTGQAWTGQTPPDQAHLLDRQQSRPTVTTAPHRTDDRTHATPPITARTSDQSPPRAKRGPVRHDLQPGEREQPPPAGDRAGGGPRGPKRPPGHRKGTHSLPWGGRPEGAGGIRAREGRGTRHARQTGSERSNESGRRPSGRPGHRENNARESHRPQTRAVPRPRPGRRPAPTADPPAPSASEATSTRVTAAPRHRGPGGSNADHRHPSPAPPRGGKGRRRPEPPRARTRGPQHKPLAFPLPSARPSPDRGSRSPGGNVRHPGGPPPPRGPRGGASLGRAAETGPPESTHPEAERSGGRSPPERGRDRISRERPRASYCEARGRAPGTRRPSPVHRPAANRRGGNGGRPRDEDDRLDPPGRVQAAPEATRRPGGDGGGGGGGGGGRPGKSGRIPERMDEPPPARTPETHTPKATGAPAGSQPDPVTLSPALVSRRHRPGTRGERVRSAPLLSGPGPAIGPTRLRTLERCTHRRRSASAGAREDSGPPRTVERHYAPPAGGVLVDPPGQPRQAPAPGSEGNRTSPISLQFQSPPSDLVGWRLDSGTNFDWDADLLEGRLGHCNRIAAVTSRGAPAPKKSGRQVAPEHPLWDRHPRADDVEGD
ncbi:collagen alpha-1(I) chain-like [Sorex araneus]|uniref:collagen alpha-1(I) chain-like n=1 Tax=Sorex araneus TaxID=42254 RepID=UPI002433C3F0|nr:collagen alpha-1(I) chain-like [Sorex araneus]